MQIVSLCITLTYLALMAILLVLAFRVPKDNGNHHRETIIACAIGIFLLARPASDLASIRDTMYITAAGIVLFVVGARTYIAR